MKKLYLLLFLVVLLIVLPVKANALSFKENITNGDYTNALKANGKISSITLSESSTNGSIAINGINSTSVVKYTLNINYEGNNYTREILNGTFSDGTNRIFVTRNSVDSFDNAFINMVLTWVAEQGSSYSSVKTKLTSNDQVLYHGSWDAPLCDFDEAGVCVKTKTNSYEIGAILNDKYTKNILLSLDDHDARVKKVLNIINNGIYSNNLRQTKLASDSTFRITAIPRYLTSHESYIYDDTCYSSPTDTTGFPCQTEEHYIYVIIKEHDNTHQFIISIRKPVNQNSFTVICYYPTSGSNEDMSHLLNELILNVHKEYELCTGEMITETVTFNPSNYEEYNYFIENGENAGMVDINKVGNLYEMQVSIEDKVCPATPCSIVDGKYYNDNGVEVSESEYNISCKTTCGIRDGKYYNDVGDEVDYDEYFSICVKKTPKCAIENGKYYDDEGDEVTKEKYIKACPKCAVENGKYYIANGVEVTKDEYAKVCPSCKVQDNKYYIADGVEVTKDEYKKLCPVCRIENDTYFDDDGEIVTKEEFEEACPSPVADNPKTGLTFNILLITTLSVIVIAILYSLRRKNKFYRV